MPKTAAPPMPVEDQLCFSLYATSMAITRAYKPLLDRLGLTYPQYLVLSALWEQDGRTVGGIADHLALESSTITPLVKRLEAAGLLSRLRNPNDERQVKVLLTSLGVALQQKTLCLGEMLAERSGMTGAELQDLNSRVQTLRRAVDARPAPVD